MDAFMTEQSHKPHIIGLTGSIGMGKSAVAAMFVAEGLALFDADAAVHILQGENGACVSEIEAVFPGTTTKAGVDRQKLGSVVLGDREKLAQLESIIHPAIAKMRADFMRAHANDDIIVFDIPLLFEKGGERGVDSIVVVSASASVQRERVLARPGMTAEKFEHILNLQMPDSEKRARADYVIDTGCSMAETKKQISDLIQNLRKTLA